MPIFGVRNFMLNQYLGSVIYNMGRNSTFWVTKLKKGRIVEFGAGHQILDSIAGVPKTLGVIFRGQQRKSGTVPPEMKVREHPLGYPTISRLRNISPNPLHI